MKSLLLISVVFACFVTSTFAQNIHNFRLLPTFRVERKLVAPTLSSSSQPTTTTTTKRHIWQHRRLFEDYPDEYTSMSFVEAKHGNSYFKVLETMAKKALSETSKELFGNDDVMATLKAEGWKIGTAAAARALILQCLQRPKMIKILYQTVVKRLASMKDMVYGLLQQYIPERFHGECLVGLNEDDTAKKEEKTPPE